MKTKLLFVTTLLLVLTLFTKNQSLKAQNVENVKHRLFGIRLKIAPLRLANFNDPNTSSGKIQPGTNTHKKFRLESGLGYRSVIKINDMVKSLKSSCLDNSISAYCVLQTGIVNLFHGIQLSKLAYNAEKDLYNNSNDIITRPNKTTIGSENLIGYVEIGEYYVAPNFSIVAEVSGDCISFDPNQSRSVKINVKTMASETNLIARFYF